METQTLNFQVENYILLDKIPLTQIIRYLDSKSEFEELTDFLQRRLDYLKDIELSTTTIIKLDRLFWDSLKYSSEISYYEFFVRKKDIHHFHQHQVSFFNKVISFEDKRYETLISCKFPEGKKKYSHQFEHIKDAIKIHWYYSSQFDLINFGQILKEKNIEIFTFDDLQHSEYQLEWLKENKKLKT